MLMWLFQYRSIVQKPTRHSISWFVRTILNGSKLDHLDLHPRFQSPLGWYEPFLRIGKTNLNKKTFMAATDTGWGIPTLKFNMSPEKEPFHKENSCPTIILHRICEFSGEYLYKSKISSFKSTHVASMIFIRDHSSFHSQILWPFLHLTEKHPTGPG